ncbi:YbhB/YbcL family Raf kinase inhibitor-like protein [Actinokineospora fastidiosa]|uniref:YbhB/YbcL family Raf kinase inhibitor-like protein n=1 Tax=Actinokineospora fastidiosa TaxID=1816 RepID=A0A918LD59_9PSEU|nr:YbhB/YbcL family Raf kinase inhibitor-like protein [Actinokineospora fastidiosa]GGS31198.1 hypothetical protein GCM10010171_26330 [Actinokineospora fastidiosa]
MPDPGSHRYDIRRTRLRGELDDHGVPDQNADDAANELLQREHPPRPVGERAGGPLGGGGGVEADGGLRLRSSAFSGHTMIPDRCSHRGGNSSPPLEWDAVPPGTEEIALLCEDPDAPGGTFHHWVVSGIPAEVTALDENAVPAQATPGRNDFGETGWGGPEPPVGDEPHRYLFRVFAVDTPLRLGADATADDLRNAVDGHVLAHGTLVGLFGR